MCMKKRPSGCSHERTRDNSSRQFIMCSNISTETMRSNDCPGSNTFMSAVITFRFFNPRRAASPMMYSRCELEFDTAVIRACGNCRAANSDSEPQPQPSSRIDLPIGELGMLDGLAQCFLLGLLQGRVLVLVEEARVFAVRSEHLCKERRRHLVVLRVGGIGVFGDRSRGHLARKGGVTRGAAIGELDRRTRAEPVDRGADDRVRQRHAFG